STVPSDQVLYTTSVGGTATTAGLSGLVTFTTSNGATTSGITNGIQLEDGETTDITLSVSRTNTSTLLGSGIWQMALKGISWATSDTATQDVYYFNLDDVKTGPVTFN
ncbi:MAG: Peptidoglycan-binding protein, partial [Bacteroidota bacterium]|nr:Peptidoglycan-binding protein [Bacteroidota bacterium]